MSKRFTGIAALAGAFLLSACGQQQSCTTPAPAAASAPANAQGQTSPLQVVVYHADWCANCRFMAPIYSDYAKSHTDVRMTAVDVTRDADLLQVNGITGIPAVVVMRDGVVIARKEGVQTAEGFASFVASAGRHAPVANIAGRLGIQSATATAAPAAGSKSIIRSNP